MAPVIHAYQALRGVSLIIATTIVAELGDITRFERFEFPKI
jgi:transposase